MARMQSERQKGESGFVVAEFGTVSGIIAILIGLLLPAVQKARVENNEGQARAGLAAAAQESSNWFRTRGVYPATPGFRYVDPKTGLPGQSAVAFGYRMAGTVNGTTMTLTAEPFIPGKTGRNAFAIQVVNGTVSSVTVFGGDGNDKLEGAKEALLVLAAETMHSIQPVSSDWSVLGVYFEMDEITDLMLRVWRDYTDVDASGKARMTFDSIGKKVSTGDLTLDGTADISPAFWEGVVRILELGAGGEDLTRAGISQLPAPEQWEATPISYTAMRAVVKVASIGDGLSNTLALMQQACTYDTQGNRIQEGAVLDVMTKSLGTAMSLGRGQVLRMIVNAQAGGYSQAAVDAKIKW